MEKLKNQLAFASFMISSFSAEKKERLKKDKNSAKVTSITSR